MACRLLTLTPETHASAYEPTRLVGADLQLQEREGTRMGKIARTTDVSQARTIADMLAMSGTDFGTRMRPVHVDGREVEGTNAIVRTDRPDVLGIVGERFSPNCHAAQLTELEPLVSSGFLVPASVAEWDNGGRLAYQFRVPELDVSVRSGDAVSPLLTLAFGHDGTFSDRSFLARFRWFCQNQMGQVRQASQGQHVRHVGLNRERYADLVQAHVRGLAGQVAEDAAAMRRMLSVPLKGRDLLGFFAGAIGSTDPGTTVDAVWNAGKDRDKLRGEAKVVRTILDDYRADDGGAPGTVWHAYNGVTRYMTHTAGRDAGARAARVLLANETETAWVQAVRLAS